MSETLASKMLNASNTRRASFDTDSPPRHSRSSCSSSYAPVLDERARSEMTNANASFRLASQAMVAPWHTALIIVGTLVLALTETKPVWIIAVAVVLGLVLR
jgi:hypothetical protein